MTVVQLPPFDGLADQVLMPHIIQHIIIGDVASLLIVIGLTGPILQPLLRIRATRGLRQLSHPLVALALWAVDLYASHIPLLYHSRSATTSFMRLSTRACCGSAYCYGSP